MYKAVFVFILKIKCSRTDEACVYLFDFFGELMKLKLSAILIACSLLTSCKQASYQSVDKDLSKSLDANSGSGTGTGENGNGNGSGNAGGTKAPNGNTLMVNVPVPELVAGGKTTTATAKTPDSDKPAVTWTVTAPAGKDPGTITDAGVYTSPTVASEVYPVTITATLKSDPAVTASVPVKIIPPSMMNLELTVTLPVPQLQVGGKKLTAVAALNDGTKNPPVKWTVTGPAGKDVGTIDPSTGVYT
ncbi:MAG: hypothetical protein EOP04_19855, partial [Proteobacteria bacterium]